MQNVANIAIECFTNFVAWSLIHGHRGGRGVENIRIVLYSAIILDLLRFLDIGDVKWPCQGASYSNEDLVLEFRQPLQILARTSLHNVCPETVGFTEVACSTLRIVSAAPRAAIRNH